jgi:hypothetical protein
MVGFDIDPPSQSFEWINIQMIAKITSRIAKRNAGAISNATLLKILIETSGSSEITIGQKGLVLWSRPR